MAEQLWIHNSRRTIKPSPAFCNELRGQTFAHCDTYAEHTRGLSTSTRLDLVVPAAETVLTDGRTDVKKKVCFWKKKSFWFGRVQTGRIFPYFGRIFPYFRTPSGRPSAKKGTFEEKKAFACLGCMGKFSKDKLSPKLSNAPACPQARPKIKARKIETMASNM